MDVVVIDVPDAWGILLSRSSSTALGGFLSMDLTHAHIPMGDCTFQILYNREKADRDVMDPDGPDYASECDYDVLPHAIECDPYELPFMQEDSINMILPWTDQYKDKLEKYHGKEPTSSQILKKEDEKYKEVIKDIVHTEPPYDENTPSTIFNEGTLVLMWDKRRGKPIYEQKEKNSWLGPYIIKMKSDKERYYLTTLDERKMPLPVDGSLLHPHIQDT
jgi:hypothetical protein